MLRARLLTCALVALAPLLAGCDGDEPTIALLVADASDSSTRAVDVERFTDRVEATCDECRVTVYDAEGDESGAEHPDEVIPSAIPDRWRNAPDATPSRSRRPAGAPRRSP